MSFVLMASPARRSRWRYRYRNTQRDPVELWVSLPRSRPGQHGMELSMTEGAPRRIHLLDVEGGAREVGAGELGDVLGRAHEAGIVNVVADYRIEPGATVRLAASYGGSALRLAGGEAAGRLRAMGWRDVPPVELSPAERAFYLRSTPLVEVDDAVRAEARDCLQEGGPPAEGAELPALAVLRRLFARLTSPAYRYAWPPPAHGSPAMRAGRMGDCGSYSTLLAAWCRALEIPARVAVGSWASGTMQGHVWTEVFVAGVGWIPADASAAALLRTDPGHFGGTLDLPRGFGGKRDPELFMGGVDRGRMVFSLELEPHPLPGYREWESPPEPAPDIPLATGPLAWGYRLSAGRVPYLQPAYPRFGGAVDAADDTALLGSWRFPAPASSVAANLVAGAALAVGAAAMLLRGWEGSPFGREASAQAGLAAFALFAAVRARTAGSYANIAAAAVLALFLVLQWVR